MIARVDVRIAAMKSCSGVDLIVPILLEGLDASLRAHADCHFAYHVRSSLKEGLLPRSHDEQTICVAIDWPKFVKPAKEAEIYGRILSLLALRTELPLDSLILIVSRGHEPTGRMPPEARFGMLPKWRRPRIVLSPICDPRQKPAHRHSPAR